MKKYFAILIIAILPILSFSQVGGFWTNKAGVLAFGGTNYWRCSGSFSIGTKGYFVGGSNAPVVYTGDNWEFDPVANTWTQKASFGGGTTSSSASFVLNGKAYLCCGANPTMQNWLWQYDPIANNWIQKANVPGPARAYNIAFSINGKGYSGLGFDASTNLLNDLYEYDPIADAWTAVANFPGGGRWSPSCFAIGGKGYLGLGATSNSWSNYSNDWWEFDPLANSWTQKGNFPGTSRAEATSFDKCNYGYLGTGHNGAGELNDFWEYDPTSDSWNQLANFPGIARSMTVGFSIADKCYIGLGYDNFVGNNGFGDMYEWDTRMDFTITDSTICQGTSVSFTDLSQHHPTTWAWTINGGTPSSSALQNPSNVVFNTPGTYTVTLVATDACGYSKTKTHTITVDGITANAGTDVAICSGASAQLTATGGGTYSWISIPAGFTSSIANPVVNPLAATSYIVTTTNANGCTANDTVVVTPATVTAGFTSDVASGSAPLPVTFTNTSTGATTYSWNFGNSNSASTTDPVYTYSQEGNYTVTLIATNSFGCADTAQMNINVDIDYSAMWVPNAFTPNGDGLNDIFSVGNYNLKEFDGKIFNRWGQLVYQWSDPSTGWDGTFKGELVEDGVYVFVVSGTGIDESKFGKTGSLTVVK